MFKRLHSSYGCVFVFRLNDNCPITRYQKPSCISPLGREQNIVPVHVGIVATFAPSIFLVNFGMNNVHLNVDLLRVFFWWTEGRTAMD
jgi:hypothetical protein